MEYNPKSFPECRIRYIRHYAKPYTWNNTRRGPPRRVAHDKRAGTRPAPTLGKIVGSFKSRCVRKCIQNSLNVDKLWQRNYYEHIIRDEKDLNKIREYIINNPITWELDDENPENIKRTIRRGGRVALTP